MQILQIAIIEESIGGPFVSVLNFHLALNTVSNKNTLLATLSRTDYFRIKALRQSLKVIPYLEESKNINPKRLSPGFISKVVSNLKNYETVHLHGFFIISYIPIIFFCRLFRKNISIQPHGSLMEYEIARMNIFKKCFMFFIRLLSIGTEITYVVTSSVESEQIPRKLIRNESQIFSTRYFSSEISLDTDQSDIDLQKLVVSQNKKVLFLGRITKKKNLNLLIEAIKYANTRNAELDLVVVGPIDSDQNYLLDFGKSTLGERFIFLGPTYSKDLKEKIMGMCQIFALPSLGENFALTLLEAESCGLHLLLSPNIGAIEVLNANKLTIVGDLHVASWGKALTSLSKSCTNEQKRLSDSNPSGESWITEAHKFSNFLTSLS